MSNSNIPLTLQIADSQNISISSLLSSLLAIPAKNFKVIRYFGSFLCSPIKLAALLLV